MRSMRYFFQHATIDTLDQEYKLKAVLLVEVSQFDYTHLVA